MTQMDAAWRRLSVLQREEADLHAALTKNLVPTAAQDATDLEQRLGEVPGSRPEVAA